MTGRMQCNIVFLIVGSIFISSAIVLRLRGETVGVMAVIASLFALGMVLTVGDIFDKCYRNHKNK